MGKSLKQTWQTRLFTRKAWTLLGLLGLLRWNISIRAMAQGCHGAQDVRPTPVESVKDNGLGDIRWSSEISIAMGPNLLSCPPAVDFFWSSPLGPPKSSGLMGHDGDIDILGFGPPHKTCCRCELWLQGPRNFHGCPGMEYAACLWLFDCEGGLMFSGDRPFYSERLGNALDPKKELVADFTTSHQTQGNIIQGGIEHGSYFKPPIRNVGVVKPHQSGLQE